MIYFLLLMLILFESVHSVPKQTIKLQSMPDYVKVIQEFNRLQALKTPEEMKTITALGLVSGAVHVRKSLEGNLSDMITDLLDKIDMKNIKSTMPKIEKIESRLLRDDRAVQILGSAMDYAREEITIDEFRSEMKKMMRSYHIEMRRPINKTLNKSVRSRLENLRTNVIAYMDTMNIMIGEKSKETIRFLVEKHGIISSTESNENIEMVAIKSSEYSSIPNFSEPIEHNVIEDVRRQDVNISETIQDERNEATSSIEIEVGPSSQQADAPSGGSPLVGLIASLSGGDQGSDVGALVGALTGIISNIFGPNGLDVPSLIGSGTALLAGLLSGDKNFGIVLGEYVGLAFDGFSGGGGAINNGQFVGNFLGTVIAQLSADPEDEDLPPKPFVFIENFLNSLQRAKSKSSDDSPKMENAGGGSFGFITHIVRAIVGGITNFILNASVGASAGFSKGSSSTSDGTSYAAMHAKYKI